jgi:hypothetical protein
MQWRGYFKLKNVFVLQRFALKTAFLLKIFAFTHDQISKKFVNGKDFSDNLNAYLSCVCFFFAKSRKTIVFNVCSLSLHVVFRLSSVPVLLCNFRISILISFLFCFCCSINPSLYEIDFISACECVNDIVSFYFFSCFRLFEETSKNSTQIRKTKLFKR